MLMQKPAEAGDIVSLKLTDGSEVIGKLVQQDNASCTLGKPVVVAINQTGSSRTGSPQTGLGFQPLLATSDDAVTVELPRSVMLTRAVRTRADVATRYRRATSDADLAVAADPGPLRP